jgi:hypothetical protein
MRYFISLILPLFAFALIEADVVTTAATRVCLADSSARMAFGKTEDTGAICRREIAPACIKSNGCAKAMKDAAPF